MPRINNGALRLLASDINSYVTPSLLFEVGSDAREDTRALSAYRIIDTLRIREFLRPGRRKWARFKSVDNVQVEYDEWVSKLSRAGYAPRELPLLSLAFPPAPDLWYPAGPGCILSVTPITTAQRLINLGQEQCHCAASYAHDVVRGRAYFYRLESRGQVATLAISRSSTQWKIMELKGPANQEVSADMVYLLTFE